MSEMNLLPKTDTWEADERTLKQSAYVSLNVGKGSNVSGFKIFLSYAGRT
jgi:hypothetical protein